MSQLPVNTICFLGIDAIGKTKSGRPGVVMGVAPVTYSLYTKYLHVNPAVPDWINRDRFILLASRDSVLFCALLHLSGFNVTIDDLKHFRQWASETPGHPECGHTDGVDTASGPLDQGIFVTVGLVQAERFLVAKYSKLDFPIFNHYIYVIADDGDFMEGMSSEASSYAAKQQPNKLTVLYDSNGICLDSGTNAAFTENVRARYNAYSWHTTIVEDGIDVNAISLAIERARASNKSSSIEIKITIGYGAPTKGGTNTARGVPLGAEETVATQHRLGWKYPPFNVPEEVYNDFRENVEKRGVVTYQKQLEMLTSYKTTYPNETKEVEAIVRGGNPAALTETDFPVFDDDFSQTTCHPSQAAINAAAMALPNFLGGSADPAHSNMTYINDDGLQDAEHPLNRSIQFGIHEFGMAAILNGVILHGRLRVFGRTFFVFSDYLKAAMRLSALQGLSIVYVFTHDFIAVGEDGPIHESIEQLLGLRVIPNLTVLHPADARETQIAWHYALTQKSTPAALVSTRQSLVVEEGTSFTAAGKGAYVVYESGTDFGTILLALGSEINLAVEAAKKLVAQGDRVRVVSVPSTELFDAQPAEYKEMILPDAVRKHIIIEMATAQPWYEYIGLDGGVVGIDTFGASVPALEVIEHYGFAVGNIVNTVNHL